jgi:microcystin-dependent protein
MPLTNGVQVSNSGQITQAFAGMCIPYSGSSEPRGFLFCNGQTVNRVANAKLFSVIGTKFGAGDGSTTFNVPDLRGEFVLDYLIAT